MGVGAPPRRGQGEQVAAAARRGRVKTRLDWRKLLAYETRVVGTVAAPPSRIVPDPSSFAIPRAHGVEYDKDGTKLRAKKYDAEKHLSAEARHWHALEFFNQTRLKCVVEEAERKRVGGGKNERGKAQSSRPDLKANTAMRDLGMYLQGYEAGGTQEPKKVTGGLMGVPVGTKYNSRAEMFACGMHMHWLAGIATYKTAREKGKKEVVVANSIAMSGGYEDDLDASDRCPYTGAGMNDLLHTGRQYADQSISENASNRAMAAACDLGLPIRVVRGAPDKDSFSGKVYTYDGLYLVESYHLVVGKSGYKVARFDLVRLDGQPPVTSASVHFKQSRSALPAKQRPEDRPGFVMADLSLGTESLPVCVVNAFDESSPHWAPPPRPLKLPPGCDSVEKISAFFLETFPRSGGVPPKDAFAYLPCGVVARSASRVPAPPPRTPTSSELRALNACTLKDPTRGPYDAKGTLVNDGCLVYEGEPGYVRGEPVKCGSNATSVGLTHRMEVFRTEGKGWGVRSWDPIKAGEFVCEFTGEMLTHSEAEKRGEHEHEDAYEGAGEYDEYLFGLNPSHPEPLAALLKGEYDDEDVKKFKASGRTTPTPTQVQKLLDLAGLSAADAETQFELDGKRAGSFARFINSSDQPNLFAQAVVTGHLDPRQCRICLFACFDIPAMTELSYDYGSEYQTNLLGDEYREQLARGSR